MAMCVLRVSLKEFPSKILAARASHNPEARVETMVRLRPAQRRMLVAHIPPLANLAAGSLLFGQFLSDRPYSPAIALVGAGTWVLVFGAAFVLAAGSDV